MTMVTRRTESALEIADTADGWHVQARRVDSYAIRLAPGLLPQLGELLRPVLGPLGAPRVVLVADSGIPDVHRRVARAALAALDVPVTTVEIPAGETSKSVDGLQQLWRQLEDVGTTRRTLLVGLGGGMVCDLLTAAAAIYMRGVPHILVPTTFLAQLDAAIGGKGGVDAVGTKNLLGAFHHPALVVIDPELTTTLPARQLRNGLAEAIKVALVADAELAALLERGPVISGDLGRLTRIVRFAVAAKLALLAPDPFELGDLRRLLNLGHCIGHPLEAATGYTLPHGEAVAIGIAVAAAVATLTGHATQAERDRILRLLAVHQLPVTMPPDLRNQVWAGVQAIRRVRNGVLHLVLPTTPGRCVILDDDRLTRGVFDHAVSALEGWGGQA
ncbi:3-dehydroquinate synthase family protein [Amycolatopsis eburnea]|uniref:Iron-containing alcohol dehydrogenase n=1 Tax=Amycolatopsis eburnea TaxID=2267691 RepID=A0A3R9F5H3_9PSEU|nr:3-dehydroquinate synthase family protein [Amycolatopsis eburnea]RSD16366.1 iron-containing alcohol dehydrogenase [Amycolatopsis eburnea]